MISELNLTIELETSLEEGEALDISVFKEELNNFLKNFNEGAFLKVTITEVEEN